MKKALLTIFVKIPLALIFLSVLYVLILKWVPVWVTPLMVKRSIEYRADDSFRTSKRWVPLEEISPSLRKCVIASEDNKFVDHNGFDFEEIKMVREAHRKKGKRLRGCSTISQQTAKNCFTFCSDSWARKAVEAYWTFLIEKIWGKERILEVYLNVIEMGKGIYGAEAAAQAYYQIPASKLSLRQSAAIAACLPSPLKRSPLRQTSFMSKRIRQISGATYNLAYPEWISK